MIAPVFVDTNVLLYAVDMADVVKQRAAHAWRDELWRKRLGKISFQVIHEFYFQATRKKPSGLDEVRAEIRDLMAWQPVPVDAVILEQGWKLQDRYRLSFWDALIVSAAKSTGCRYLLTEDMQTGQDLDGILVISPFLTDPTFLYLK